MFNLETRIWIGGDGMAVRGAGRSLLTYEVPSLLFVADAQAVCRPSKKARIIGPGRFTVILLINFVGFQLPYLPVASHAGRHIPLEESQD